MRSGKVAKQKLGTKQKLGRRWKKVWGWGPMGDGKIEEDSSSGEKQQKPRHWHTGSSQAR